MSEGSKTQPEPSGLSVTADEIALYDRQIRLWGLEAQNRMRNAHILIINVGAVANEVIKNVVLAGIGSLTIVDTHNVHPDDLGAQFLVSDEDIGSNRAEATKYRISRLNPRVGLNVEKITLEEMSIEWLGQFEVVVATELSYLDLCMLNEKTRQTETKFYAAGLFGLCGYVFADLVEHKFLIEREKPNIPTKIGPETSTRRILDVVLKKEAGQQYMETLTKQESYVCLNDAIERATTNGAFGSGLNTRKKLRVSPILPALLAYWKGNFKQPSKFNVDDDKKDEQLVLFKDSAQDMARKLGLPAGILTDEFLCTFLRAAGSELAPVSAIVGGVLGQEVLNVLGHKEQPIQNLFLFDGDTCSGPIYVV